MNMPTFKFIREEAKNDSSHFYAIQFTAVTHNGRATGGAVAMAIPKNATPQQVAKIFQDMARVIRRAGVSVFARKKRAALKSHIASSLKNGALGVTKLADITGSQPSSIYCALHELLHECKVERVHRKWRLAHYYPCPTCDGRGGWEGGMHGETWNECPTCATAQ